jgi:RNA polymerase sigma factor for flagellar operon FliA
MNEQTQQAEVLEAEAYIPFVRKIAMRIARRLPQSVDLDDLINAGTVGLMEALDRYQPNGNPKFEAYAEFRIKGAILDELRRLDPLNRVARHTKRMLAEKAAQLTAAYGRPPDAVEMAEALNTSVETYVGKLSPMQSLRVVSMDTDAIQPEERLMNQEDLVCQRELLNFVKQRMGELPRREQLILSLYYVEELTQNQIGQVLGVSESRVCQILSRTVKRLREHVEKAS